MEQEIYELVSSGKNVLLVGKQDSGKTFFVINKLIPFLESQGRDVKYCKDLDEDINPVGDEVVILDEVEILDDKEFLEKLHPDDSPFYTEKYLERAEGWLKKINEIINPTVFILTRNDDMEIENLRKIERFSFKEDIRLIEFK